MSILQLSVVKYCGEDVIKLLLSKGAEINYQDEDGFTPLHWACLKLHEAAVRLLLSKGADLSLKSESGMTPFCGLQAFERTDEEGGICQAIMIKELSKMDFGNAKVPEMDMLIVRPDPEFRAFFESCKTELQLMAARISFMDLIRTTPC